MPYPHVIRLRGPWEYQPLASWRRVAGGGWEEETSNLPSPGRVKLADDWSASLGPDFLGRVRYTRHFNRPTGLEARERVWLVVEGADAAAEVQVNSHMLGAVRGYALPASFDITSLLEQRNELSLDVELPPPDAADVPPRPGREQKPGGPIREVRLEVRSDVWLRRMYMHMLEHLARPALRVIVDVPEESADDPLSLLILVQRREFYFGPVERNVPLVVENYVNELPPWTPGVRCYLGTAEVRLLRQSEAVWEATYPIAYRPVSLEPPAALQVCGSEVALPAPLLEITKLGDPPQTLPGDQVAALAEILTDEQYGQLDALGQGVIQQVPITWSDTVCPALAHHPSIVAWMAPAAELDAVYGPTRDEWCGRPWLPQELVLARE